MKVFNTTAVCEPSEHYMVNITDRLETIRNMVDRGKYLCINRARQYGKTTTLFLLERTLSPNYYVVLIDFQDYGTASFHDEDTFCRDFIVDFCTLLSKQIGRGAKDFENSIQQLSSMSEDKDRNLRLFNMFRGIKRVWDTSDKPIVLIIDEVDSATNNQLFIDFLASLRSHYLKRQKATGYRSFQSVILAGVTDIRHIKSRMRDETDTKENSPWNIAADFTIDMSLSEPGIKGMLDEYEADHHTGMNTEAIAHEIHEYTNGYPFLVSRICQLIDEQLVPVRFDTLSKAWTDNGIQEAVKILTTEKNTLFESLMGKIRDYATLRDQIKNMLFRGEAIEYLPDNKEQEQLEMYGFIINNQNTVILANKIFEMRLFKYFVGESKYSKDMRREVLKNKPEFIKDGQLDIPLIMERFIESQRNIRNMNDAASEKKYIEEEGRERFLTYLSPIINGVGTYSIEDRTSDQGRMDVVIHYNGRRYIIELKIWRGDRYNEKGEQQIIRYLNCFGLTTGYMLSFSFNKNKVTGIKQILVGDKLLYEGIV